MCIMALKPDELARRDNLALQLRTDPLRVTWRFDNLVSADAHQLRVELSCGIATIDSPAERRFLAETFLGSASVLTTADVVEHFKPVLRGKAEALCRGKSAMELMSDAGKAALRDALLRAADQAAFKCGLRALAPVDLSLCSPTLEQIAFEQMQRRLAEEQARGRLEHLRRAGEMLKQFEELRRANPGLEAGELLALINPADRSDMLRIMLLASAGEAPCGPLWAVSGTSLLRIEPGDGEPATTTVPLPQHDLGPLRSVRCDDTDGTLLLGARDGAIVADLDRGLRITAYRAGAGAGSPLGFNRVVRWGGEIWATHSETGVVAWKTDAPDKPYYVIAPTELGGPPRNLTVIDDADMVFSVDDRLVTIARDREGHIAVDLPGRSLGAKVTGILKHGDRVVAALADGRVQIHTGWPLRCAKETRAPGKPTALGLLPWLNGFRILLITGEGALVASGVSDELLTHYAANEQMGHAAAASRRFIAAVSRDRTQIAIWRPWEPDRPAAQIPVPEITGHTAADLAVHASKA